MIMSIPAQRTTRAIQRERGVVDRTVSVIWLLPRDVGARVGPYQIVYFGIISYGAM
jgi:hypothetical protein